MSRPSIFWLILNILAWGFVHSIMASLGFRDLLRRSLGDGLIRFHRLFHDVISIPSFVPILYLMVDLPYRDLNWVSAPWRHLMLAGQGLFVLLLIVAILQTDALSFAGIRQIFSNAKSAKLI